MSSSSSLLTKIKGERLVKTDLNDAYRNYDQNLFLQYLLYKGQFWVCHMLLIGRVSGVVTRPRSPRGALSTLVVSTAPAPDGDGHRESVCARDVFRLALVHVPLGAEGTLPPGHRPRWRNYFWATVGALNRTQH